MSETVPSAGVGGIHHVTAICGDPARNVAFYTRMLGLRFVKRTVNYDDPSVWHLYFGDELGSPGSILTFFPFDHAAPGRRGAGEVGSVALAVPVGSLGFWRGRLTNAGVAARDQNRFGAPALVFEDPDGLTLELVERPVAGAPWLGGGVGADHAIRGVEGVALLLADAGPSESLLTRRLGYARADVEQDAAGGGERIRLIHPTGGLGAHVDLLARPDLPRARSGAGSVHHVAFRAADDAAQQAAGAALTADRIGVTEVRDRNYFRSIYFREPGGVLFEIATDGPGFSIDEAPDALGGSLKLPPWLEPRRAAIERALPPLETADAAAG